MPLSGTISDSRAEFYAYHFERPNRFTIGRSTRRPTQNCPPYKCLLNPDDGAQRVLRIPLQDITPQRRWGISRSAPVRTLSAGLPPNHNLLFASHLILTPAHPGSRFNSVNKNATVENKEFLSWRVVIVRSLACDGGVIASSPEH